MIATMAVALSACFAGTQDASADGQWELTDGVVTGTPLLPIETHPVTLTIDGSEFGGTAACNLYGGQLPGGGFTMRQISVTEMACSPPETMELEALYLDGLGRVESSSVEDGSLVLTGPETRLVFEAIEPIPQAELLDTTWVLDGLIDGVAISSVSGERATLTLSNDGSFTGSTGCRDFSGSYIIDGAEVQFTDFAATGSCSQELSGQDSHVISSLEGVFRVEVDEDRLTTWTAGDQGLSYVAER